MALSVYTFGTGGKRKHIFQNIYFSVEDTDGVGVLYTKTGEYSAVLKIENPVQKYSADIDSYYDFTHLFSALAQTLGEGYALHKQDIFVRNSSRTSRSIIKNFSQHRTSVILMGVRTRTAFAI